MERPYLRYLETKYRFPRSLVHRPIQRFFQSYLDAAPAGARVLDAGCGSGIDTGPYSEKLRVLGIDNQPTYLAHCTRRYPRAAYVRCDVGRLGLDDETIDLVVLNQVIEHLTDPLETLHELSRVLVAGGRLVVSTPNYASWGWPVVEMTYHRFFATNFDVEENHVTHYTPALIMEHLSHSLLVEHLDSICANTILVAAARRAG